ncbi:MAG TPA: nucleotidyltransferase domain-containing protein [Longimicrobium sp.]|nr:nucleotidyltransferase domain-containing protein [Longimicrobium sp.]
MMNDKSIVPGTGVIDADPQGADAPVFAGTSTPVQALVEALEGGWSIEEFLERNPSVRREQVITVLSEGMRALLATAGHKLEDGTSRVARDKSDVLRRLTSASARIRALGVRRLALFGSFVRGEQRSGSDVDLLVEFEQDQKTLTNFMGLADLLEELLGRKVQLVSRDGLSPHIGPHILKEAEHVPLAA